MSFFLYASYLLLAVGLLLYVCPRIFTDCSWLMLVPLFSCIDAMMLAYTEFDAQGSYFLIELWRTILAIYSSFELLAELAHCTRIVLDDAVLVRASLEILLILCDNDEAFCF